MREQRRRPGGQVDDIEQFRDPAPRRRLIGDDAVQPQRARQDVAQPTCAG